MIVRRSDCYGAGYGAVGPGSRGITKPAACLVRTAMRLKLAATSALAAVVLVMALFAERRTRPTLADEHGD